MRPDEYSAITVSESEAFSSGSFRTFRLAVLLSAVTLSSRRTVPSVIKPADSAMYIDFP